MTRDTLQAALVVVALAAPIRLKAQLDEEQRVQESMTIFSEVMSAPESAIPTSILARAEGIAVFPGTTGGGLIVGGQRRAGILSARVTGTRDWSAPGFMTITGGTVGRQIGQTDDVVLVIIDRRSLQNVVSRNFRVGADASVAPGPVGRDASASTDVQMRAKIFSYWRSRGVFAGVSLSGASVSDDRDGNQRFYGRKLGTADVVFRGMAGGTGLVRDWKDLLARHAR